MKRTSTWLIRGTSSEHLCRSLPITEWRAVSEMRKMMGKKTAVKAFTESQCHSGGWPDAARGADQGDLGHWWCGCPGRVGPHGAGQLGLQLLLHLHKPPLSRLHLTGRLGGPPDSDSVARAPVGSTPASETPWRLVVAGDALTDMISQLLTQLFQQTGSKSESEQLPQTSGPRGPPGALGGEKGHKEKEVVVQVLPAVLLYQDP